jgi:hypothetical protein
MVLPLTRVIGEPLGRILNSESLPEDLSGMISLLCSQTEEFAKIIIIALGDDERRKVILGFISGHGEGGVVKDFPWAHRARSY